MRLGQKPRLVYQHHNQINAEPRWTCNHCGAPQHDAPTVHLCPGEHGGDYAAMLCECCPDCTKSCANSNEPL